MPSAMSAASIVIPLPKGRIQPDTPIKRGTDQWATLYRRRTSVEREFGRLKHEYGLAFLRLSAYGFTPI
jgi:hypothetical protein